MRDFDHKLSIQIQLFTKRVCEILRTIILIINIPLESIFEADTADSDVQ
jgi:hypothetical protein